MAPNLFSDNLFLSKVNLNGKQELKLRTRLLDEIDYNFNHLDLLVVCIRLESWDETRKKIERSKRLEKVQTF